jgi:beta-lactamase class A
MRCPFSLLLALNACIASRPALVQPPPSLADKLHVLTSDFAGDVGLYVRHLDTQETVAIRADDVFPTASLIKLPILIRVLERVQMGEIDYHAPLTYTKDRLYPGEDLLGACADGSKIDVSKLCLLMITLSDNTASLWLQELAGTGTAINAWLAAKGFVHTRVNSRTPGREADKEAFGWGQTTPREMAELLVLVRQGQAGTPAQSDEMRRILGRSYWDGEALSALPPHVAALSKQGAVSHSRSEVVLVHAPGGDYVFCVITKNQRDTTWERDNAGFQLLRAVSRTVWEHFVPGQAYRPAPGAARFG